MSDFASFGDDDGNFGNLPEFSVSEISQAVKRTLESRFERVRVRGEISGFKRAASGHLYMALKDENAVLDGVCWKGVASRLGIRPEDGLEVIATGRITSYPGRSKYQIVIDSMELAGEGALLKLLEERRKKLAAEGLFDEDRKKTLPYLPEVIGVVTSPTGAVIRDILHRLSDRFPRPVLVWPVLVQGEGAAEQVAAAIRGFNALPGEGGTVQRPDLLIVARGGGSLEDLWAFNEEVVVRAAAESEIPLISAVGHETDTTLIDYASDRRAPTPTAAAEMAVPLRRDLIGEVSDLDRRLLSGLGRMLDERRVMVEGFARGLPRPKRLLEEANQRLDDRSERLESAIRGTLKDKGRLVGELASALPHPRQQLKLAGERLAADAARLARSGQEAFSSAQREFQRIEAGPRLFRASERGLAEARRSFEGMGRVLESLSYRKVLERGFAVVHGEKGIVTRVAGLASAGALALEFADGRASVTLGDTNVEPRKPKPAPKAKPSKPAKKGDDPQGSLL